MIAYVEQATMSDGNPFPLMPLWNVVTEDGRHFNDLTAGQLKQLADREGWQLVEPPKDASPESGSAGESG